MHQLKNDFPLLANQPNLIYLDSAATSQKPNAVIDAISQYYQTSNANIHRSVYQLADTSTDLWLQGRKTVAKFFGALPDELILTRNTTEAINGAAYGWGEQQLQTGDLIIASLMEHHANLIPWQELAWRKGAKLELIPVSPGGELELNWLADKIKTHGSKIKLIAVAHVSNALGTFNDVEKIVQMAKKVGARVLVDGAQSAPHLPVNFAKLGADFFAFSGHKMLGSMGIGGLLVKKELIEADEFRPWLFGGGMIDVVENHRASYHPDPQERFTAGTPDVASLVGLAAACDYLAKIGMKQVRAADEKLVALALEKLSDNRNIKIVGQVDAAWRVGSVTFVHKSVHAHDVAQVLASEGLAVRSGHHCTMPLHRHFGWSATVRASFHLYNSVDDVEALAGGLAKVDKVFL